jgi:hypothetical protein
MPESRDPADVYVKIRHKHNLAERVVTEAALPGFVNPDDPTKEWEVVEEDVAPDAADSTGAEAQPTAAKSRARKEG